MSACVTAPSVMRAASQTGRITRGYVNGPFGQMHYYHTGPQSSVKTPLVLFHPTAVSGAIFDDFMLDMGRDRYVIAIDTPGYGRSDDPPVPQDMAALANAMAVALDALGLSSVDALGYHTGCYIAAELAVQRPDLIRRLVLPGIPYYSEADRPAAFAKYAQHPPIAADGSGVQEIWDFWVTGRAEGVPLAHGVEHFTDHVASYPQSTWAYEAVFSYPAEDRFPFITQPVLIPNTGGSLNAASIAAAKFLSDVTIIDMSDIDKGVFDIGVARIAKASREFLDN